MRVDDAHHILGLRLNDWTAMIVFLLAVTYMVISAKKRPGRELVVEPAAVQATVVSGEDGEGDATGGEGATEKSGGVESATTGQASDAKVPDPKTPDPAEAGAAEPKADEPDQEADSAAEDATKDEAGSASKKS